MSLFTRKPRPLTRDSQSLRDDRLFIVACDDTFAPRQYFNFFRISRIKIHVVPTEDGSSAAPHVLARLLEFERDTDDQLWLLLDTDHCIEPNHIATFSQTLAEARRQGVNVALSRPCFEVWLLLHHVDHSDIRNLENANQTELALRTILGEYNKRKLKKHHFVIGQVAQACIRANSLDDQVGANLIPNSTTTRVYQLWRAIVEKALPSQLPIELRDPRILG